MHRGVTLLELLVVLTMVGILALVGAPAFGGWRDRYAVSHAAGALAGAHLRARMHSVLSGGLTELEVRPDSLIVRIVSGTDTTVIWASPGPASQGVTLSGAPRVVRFIPLGISYGFGNATFGLSRGVGHRQVIVSRLGRVRITP